MKKKITRITITRDTDDELLLEISRKSRNGVELLTSTNSIDTILEIIQDILYEADIKGSNEISESAGTEGCNYKLVNNEKDNTSNTY